ncbi:uncharacterized protein [Henckelia pumila]|uniref:uncharacterized protein n=1 Tax=Henckelia pumila TaxID=405737 RepID=UPI003C6E4BB1
MEIMRETLGILSTSDDTPVVSITLFVTLLCTCIVIGHLLEENRWMNESITSLIIEQEQILSGVRVVWPFLMIGSSAFQAVLSILKESVFLNAATQLKVFIDTPFVTWKCIVCQFGNLFHCGFIEYRFCLDKAPKFSKRNEST